VQVNGGVLATTNLTIGAVASDVGSLILRGSGTLVTNLIHGPDARVDAR
jgi:hypothetical protein